jgi:hypothetical protein
MATPIPGSSSAPAQLDRDVVGISSIRPSLRQACEPPYWMGAGERFTPYVGVAMRATKGCASVLNASARVQSHRVRELHVKGRALLFIETDALWVVECQAVNTPEEPRCDKRENTLQILREPEALHVVNLWGNAEADTA